MASGRSRRAGTVGLSDDSTADREISKCLFCSTAGSSGRCRAMVPYKGACAEAFVLDPRRSSGWPPPAPAVLPRRGFGPTRM